MSGVPEDILDKVEAAQPYQSPYGPESNLFYWVHELARTDRHRSLHVGLGRVGSHRIRLCLPEDVTASFDESVKPYQHIVGELVVGRFTTSKPISRFAIEADLTGVGVDPEIQAWAGFDMGGQRPSLQKRMTYTELFTRNNLENMALFSGIEPLGGFTTLDPADAT